MALHLRSRARRGDRALPQARADGPAGEGMAVEGRSREAAHHRFHRRPERAIAEGHLLHRTPGTGRADLRADARSRQGLVPRLGLAAGDDPALPGLRHALCLGLPDPAHARREAARGPGRPDARLHRSPCLVRSLPAGCGLDRPRSDLRPADRRGPHPARVHTRTVERRADRRRRGEGRGTIRARDVGQPHPRDAAHDQALHRRSVAEAARHRGEDRERHLQGRPREVR